MSSPNLIVAALAGTGKTFTIVEGIHVLRGTPDLAIIPSPQQEQIWKQIGIGETLSAVCFAAFNVSIKEEMEKRLQGVSSCKVTTIHGMGFQAIRNAVGMTGETVKVNQYKTDDLLEKIHDDLSIRNIRTLLPGYPKAVKRLVQLSKYKLLSNPSDEELIRIAAHYDVDLGKNSHQIFNSVKDILLLAMQTNILYELGIDFDDMIWLPIVTDLPIKKYDLLMVDEGQDLNHCQQQLALRAGERIVLVGDKHQAIYGFAGADTESIANMHDSLCNANGCKVLPLTVTRRCSHAVTEEAQKIVPEFEAHPSNSLGSVELAGLFSRAVIEELQPNDMILCRINAPLIKCAFLLISNGMPAEIIGRDIKGNLLNLIYMLKATDVDDLLVKLEQHEEKEVARIKRQKHYSESQVLAIEDKCACLRIFCRYADSIHSVIDNIEKIFFLSNKSNKTGVRDVIRLSSIHRAKGLEAHNVYILHPELLPHPLAKSEWELQQEQNLKYVAITRAIDNLTWVQGD